MRIIGSKGKIAQGNNCVESTVIRWNSWHKHYYWVKWKYHSCTEIHVSQSCCFESDRANENGEISAINGYSLEHKQVVSGILRVQRNGISCLILSNSRIEILIGFAAWSHVGLNDGLNNNQFYEWWKRMEIHFNFVNNIEKCQLFMIAVYCVSSYFCIWKYWKDLLVFSFFFLCCEK